ncbi:MAG: hypothetical protein AAF514_03915 [Verrucomicrobiota bacterium]
MDSDLPSIHFTIPAQDSMDREEVEGKLRAEKDHLVFDWKIPDRAFAKGKGGTLQIPYTDIEDFQVEKRWFRKRILIMRLRNQDHLKEVPGIGVGLAELEVSPRSRTELDSFLKHIDYNLSELRLNKAMEKLDDLSD